MARGRLTGGGSLVLDCQGLSLYLEQDRGVMNRVRSALERGADRVVSGATLIEAQHGGIKRARWNYVLSQLRVESLSAEWSKEAASLLRETGLHGHKYAIDAMVAVTALHQPGPVVILTSDIDDMVKLPLGGRLFQAEATVASAMDAYERLRAHALPPDDSFNMIRTIAKEFQ